MSKEGDIKRLLTSWTKYDVVKVIESIGTNKLDEYLTGEEEINNAVLKSFIGISKLDDNLPSYWKEIQKFPEQKLLFALAVGIFTHYKNIKLFAEEYSTKNMMGLFKIGDGGKHLTNLRSALVVSGAAKNSDRRKSEVLYDLSPLFSVGELGLHFREVVFERLLRVGYSRKYLESELFAICNKLKFPEALSLTRDQFKRWLKGKSIYQVKQFDYNLELLAPDNRINAFQVHQWQTGWESVKFNDSLRRKPDGFFYMFSMDIRLLKRLSDVHRRRPIKRRIYDTAVQRNLDENRSSEISRYVESGFPFSTLSKKERELPENEGLRMPGILPTAIVANILGPGEKRGNNVISDDDLIRIEEASETLYQLVIPDAVFQETWDPDLRPIEIIDGQHRLMAFDETEVIDGRYEVPVVAYYNLARTWQAYLFYVINIKPKKINTSLGYDLYPLLRTQEWLQGSKNALIVYRETRAQELVEALWFYEQSPWYGRINMLSASEGNNISQSAFIRALSTTYLKTSVRKDVSGLFADVLPNRNYEEIKWVRSQQAAFLILLWEQIAVRASESDQEWAQVLISQNKESVYLDSIQGNSSSFQINGAFLSKNSMLSRDQGVNGISRFTNDLFFVIANFFPEYDFNEISFEDNLDEASIEEESLDKAIGQFRNSSLYGLLCDVAEEIPNFDWRTSNADFEDEAKKELQKKYRGSGGYLEVYNDLIDQFSSCNNEALRNYAEKLKELVR